MDARKVLSASLAGTPVTAAPRAASLYSVSPC